MTKKEKLLLRISDILDGKINPTTIKDWGLIPYFDHSSTVTSSMIPNHQLLPIALQCAEIVVYSGTNAPASSDLPIVKWVRKDLNCLSWIAYLGYCCLKRKISYTEGNELFLDGDFVAKILSVKDLLYSKYNSFEKQMEIKFTLVNGDSFVIKKLETKPTMPNELREGVLPGKSISGWHLKNVWLRWGAENLTPFFYHMGNTQLMAEATTRMSSEGRIFHEA